MAKFAKYPKLPKLSSFKGHTRAFLKVQDGCDGLCSYCIVPKVRPDVQSKPFDEAIEEAKALVAAGHKEIVFTGINLGAYGQNTTRRGEPMCSPNMCSPNAYLPNVCPPEFRGQESENNGRGRPACLPNACPPESDGQKSRRGRPMCLPIVNLLKNLAKIDGLLRIRVSSLEPGDIIDELLDVFCSHPNIMPHIHLSVQSGSSATLKRMCRQYDAEELREKIELIKQRLDSPAITCDIIVGFPGETDEDFAETVELSKWAGFSKIHVFPFSVRAGTPAAKLKGRLPADVIKKRAQILRKVSDELGFKFREQFVGQTCEVLLEDAEPPSGRCERYFIVKVKTKNDKVKNKNDIVKVKITAATEEGAEGEVSI